MCFYPLDTFRTYLNSCRRWVSRIVFIVYGQSQAIGRRQHNLTVFLEQDINMHKNRIPKHD